jgi:hypothetical protein
MLVMGYRVYPSFDTATVEVFNEIFNGKDVLDC